MNAKEFDNEIVCRAVYAWVKGSGPEPYSPTVASLTCLVLAIVDAERVRSDPDPEWNSGMLETPLARVRALSRPNELHLPNMDATAAAWVALAYVASAVDGVSDLLQRVWDIEDEVEKLKERMPR